MTEYRPLPSNLTIEESYIHGLGLFATKGIPSNTVLGVTHHVIDHRDYRGGHEVEIIRTPLGGFYNHSNTPNCMTVFQDGVAKLVTLRDILCGEELSAKYGTINKLKNL